MNIQNIRRPVTLSRVGRGVYGAWDIARHLLIIASHVIIIVVVVVAVAGALEPRRRHTAGARVRTHLVGVFILGSIDCTQCASAFVPTSGKRVRARACPRSARVLRAADARSRGGRSRTTATATTTPTDDDDNAD